MNTNGSRMIDEIITLLKRKIMVIVTISFDGVGDIHDYVRWPIKWEKFIKTVNEYKKLQEQYKLLKLDFWTTVSCLNIKNLPDIIEYAKSKNIPHAWAFLNTPDALNVKYKNSLTIGAEHIAPDQIAITEDNSNQLELFIKKQDHIRKININDYLSF
jgi:sulfatase maturation enzyme AslB (radical SAM superfamily)